MLNNKDPLIGAVQEVMKKNQAERDAVKLVNEKFGVVDRRALPREQQANWDAAYKAVLTEGVETLDEKVEMTKKQFANLDGNPKFTSNDLAHARAGTHKKKAAAGELEESDVTSPSSMGIKKPDYASGTPDYANKGPQMVNRAGKGNAETGMGRAENIAHQGNSVTTKTTKSSSSVMPSTMKEEMTDAQMKKREKIVMSMKKKMAGFKDRYGKRAKDVMYATATKQAMKEDNEGFNNRHDLSVTASDENQIVAGQLNEVAKRIQPGVNDHDTEGNRVYMGGGGFNPAATPDKIGGPDRNRGMEAGGRGRRISISNAPGLSQAAKTRFKKRLDAIQNAAPKNPKNALKTAKKSPTAPAQPAPGERNYDTPIGRLVAKQNAKNAKAKANARPAKDFGGARAEFLARVKGTTPAPAAAKPATTTAKPAATSAARKARVKAISRSATPTPAADLKPGDMRSQTIAKNTYDAVSRSVPVKVSPATNAKRVAAIRRTPGLKAAVPAVAAGATVLATTTSTQKDNKPATAADKPKKSQGILGPGWQERVPQADAKPRSAASGLTTGSGSVVPATAKPRSAASGLTTGSGSVVPAKAKPVTQSGTSSGTPAKAPTQQPVQKKAAPVAAAPTKRQPLQTAYQRNDIAGPSGTGKVVGGVTSGTKVMQKSTTSNKNLPGK